MTDAPAVTLADQIAAVQREIARRKQLPLRLVKFKKPEREAAARETAERELAAMRAVLATLAEAAGLALRPMHTAPRTGFNALFLLAWPAWRCWTVAHWNANFQRWVIMEPVGSGHPSVAPSFDDDQALGWLPLPDQNALPGLGQLRHG